MIHCLSLIDQSHIRAGADGDRAFTSCGLSIAIGSEPAVRFVDDDAEPSCARCKNRVAAFRSLGNSALSGKAVPIALLEYALTKNDAAAAAELIATPQEDIQGALTRLHEIFPKWTATITELIEEGPRIFARFRVAANDGLGLLCNEPGMHVVRDELAIFVIAKGKVVAVDAVRDSFAIWQALTPNNLSTSTGARNER